MSLLSSLIWLKFLASLNTPIADRREGWALVTLCENILDPERSFSVYGASLFSLVNHGLASRQRLTLSSSMPGSPTRLLHPLLFRESEARY
ncbi:hypothetical protein F5X98DRAFT_357473 [Xylaria grammica]|nr:hypothetical protein F5X98DRAFT_357473 [Xylaria grammica]